MKINWLKELSTSGGRAILVGDVGGTNTNLGLAQEVDGRIDLIMEAVFDSHEIQDFLPVVQKTMDAVRTKYSGLKFDLCCISAAGPVQNNVCQMTNQSWKVDGNHVQQALGLPTLIINDFTSISYGIPLLDIHDPRQIQILKRPGRSEPMLQGDLMAVAGAGTGLGVGFISRLDERYRAFPSEGGHMDLAGLDEETRGFKSWIQEGIGAPPEWEMAVSGMGIKNLFYYLLETGDLDKSDELVQEVLRLPDTQKPQNISKNAGTHPGFRHIMETFVRLYARFAASVCCLLLPRGGFYLAGGISGKNLDYFLKDDLFVKTFENHCNPNLRQVLEQIPLFIIKDYSISLYGAANAALSLMV